MGLPTLSLSLLSLINSSSLTHARAHTHNPFLLIFALLFDFGQRSGASGHHKNIFHTTTKCLITYVQGFSEIDPSRLGLDVKVVELCGVVGRGDAVADGPVVVRVLVGGRDAEDVGTDVRVLLHVLNVFLEKKQIMKVCY